MTAYARTLLKRHHNEKLEEQDATILASCGLLVAKLVDNFDNLTKKAKKMADNSVKIDENDIFIIIEDQNNDDEIIALAPMALTSHEDNSDSFKSAALFSEFEFHVNQPDPSLLSIAPFAFANQQAGHRAQGLLWHAIARYCTIYDIDYVVGSLAFESRYPAAHALELSYLHHYCRSTNGLRAMAKNGVTMDIVPEEAIKPEEVFSRLPASLRYCLQIGGKVGDNAIVDQIRNQTRIFVLFSARAFHV